MNGPWLAQRKLQRLQTQTLMITALLQVCADKLAGLQAALQLVVPSAPVPSPKVCTAPGLVQTYAAPQRHSV